MTLSDQLISFIEKINGELGASTRFGANSNSSRVRLRVVEEVLLPLACAFDNAVEKKDVGKCIKYALMMYRTMYHEFRRIKNFGSGLPFDRFISKSDKFECQNVIYTSLFDQEKALDFPGKLIEFRNNLIEKMSGAVFNKPKQQLNDLPTGALNKYNHAFSGDWKFVNNVRKRNPDLESFFDRDGHVVHDEKVIKRGRDYFFYKREIRKDEACKITPNKK
jgi:hypothetical protein